MGVLLGLPKNYIWVIPTTSKPKNPSKTPHYPIL
jgi:hypothetical protein